MIIVIMGVAGSGKTTVGSLLAQDLGWDFFDADDFHSQENREKMSRRIPLTDEDRSMWLIALRDLIKLQIKNERQTVLACSALKKSYRELLGINDRVRFVHLKGAYQLIEARLRERAGHFMSAEMLASQFEILEDPPDALTIEITKTPQEIADIIRKGFNL